MNRKLNVATAPKTATFQMRINPEIKQQAESVFAQCGLTLTDAVNIFIQQSINAEAMPFIITSDSRSAMHEQAVSYLMSELEKGEQSAVSEDSWIPEEELLKKFGGG